MKNPDLMDVSEAAEYVGRTVGATRMLVARGKIPHRRLGRRVQFFKSEIDRWLKFAPGLTPEDIEHNGFTHQY